MKVKGKRRILRRMKGDGKERKGKNVDAVSFGEWRYGGRRIVQ